MRFGGAVQKRRHHSCKTSPRYCIQMQTFREVFGNNGSACRGLGEQRCSCHDERSVRSSAPGPLLLSAAPRRWGQLGLRCGCRVAETVMCMRTRCLTLAQVRRKPWKRRRPRDGSHHRVLQLHGEHCVSANSDEPDVDSFQVRWGRAVSLFLRRARFRCCRSGSC